MMTITSRTPTPATGQRLHLAPLLAVVERIADVQIGMKAKLLAAAVVVSEWIGSSATWNYLLNSTTEESKPNAWFGA